MSSVQFHSSIFRDLRLLLQNLTIKEEKSNVKIKTYFIGLNFFSCKSFAEDLQYYHVNIVVIIKMLYFSTMKRYKCCT